MAALGYNETWGPVQTYQTDINLRYLVAALNLFGVLLAWISIKFVYNIDKNTITQMEKALGHEVKQ